MHLNRRRVDRLLASFRTLGPLETVKAIVHKLSQSDRVKQGLRFDRRYGTETDTIVRATELDVSETARRNAYDYVPIGNNVFNRIFRSLGEDLSGYVFVDLGSGKGRAVLLAAQLPFRRVVGIEISPRLHQISVDNLRILRTQKDNLADVVLIQGDATHHQGTGEDSIYYMYHPFDESIVVQVLDNLRRSASDTPHRILVVSVGERRHVGLSGTDFLYLREDHEVYVRDFSWAVYEGRIGSPG